MNERNLQEITRLNQRGGRPLSLLDLVEANTVDLAAASFLAGAVAAGASLLTAARPGNAGKTTVLAALLAFLAGDRHIRTVEDTRVLADLPEKSCLLAHEIGSGPYYGYLWGADARRFFEASAAGAGMASCIHADTLEELRAILCGPAIGLSPEAFARIDLIALLRLDRTRTGYRRRVASIYAGTGAAGTGSHQRVFRWDEHTDTFVAEDIPDRWQDATEHARELLERLRAAGHTDFENVFREAQKSFSRR